MALVEWWILANFQWIGSGGGSNCSETAAGSGFGPLGHLERLDIIRDMLRAYEKYEEITVFRKDWNTKNCK